MLPNNICGKRKTGTKKSINLPDGTIVNDEKDIANAFDWILVN